jgi:hypothetical protein
MTDDRLKNVIRQVQNDMSNSMSEQTSPLAGGKSPGENKSMMGRIASHLVDRFKAIPKEISATFWERSGPQGAAELAQSFHSQSNAYVPYGPGQQPEPTPAQEAERQVTVEDAKAKIRAGGVHGKTERNPSDDPFAAAAARGSNRSHSHDLSR